MRDITDLDENSRWYRQRLLFDGRKSGSSLRGASATKQSILLKGGLLRFARNDE